jgi:hypothetical protein
VSTLMSGILHSVSTTCLQNMRVWAVWLGYRRWGWLVARVGGLGGFWTGVMSYVEGMLCGCANRTLADWPRPQRKVWAECPCKPAVRRRQSKVENYADVGHSDTVERSSVHVRMDQYTSLLVSCTGGCAADEAQVFGRRRFHFKRL